MASDRNYMNVQTLEDSLLSFQSCETAFQNISYATFKNGYISSCGDSKIQKYCKSLDKDYQRLSIDYQGILEWWKDYNNDVSSLENSISKESSSFIEGSIRNYINKNLEPYPLSNYEPNYARMEIKELADVNATQDTSLQNFSDLTLSAAGAIALGQLGKFSPQMAAIHSSGNRGENIQGGTTAASSYAMGPVNTTGAAGLLGGTMSSGFANTGTATASTGNRTTVTVGTGTLAAGYQGGSVASTMKYNGTSYEADLQNTAATISKDSKTLSESLTSLFFLFAGTTIELLLKTGATIAVIYFSLIKGIARLIEALVDLVIIVVGASISGIALPIGFVASIFNDEKGTKLFSDTWAKTRSMVSYNGTNFLFDVKGTSLGDFFENFSCISTDGTVSGFLEGIGYVAGIVILTFVTLGAGGVAATSGGAAGGATTVVTTTSAASTSSVTSTAIAAAAGMGSGTERAWNDGASTVEGLIYGGASAIWESFQYYLGAKLFNTNFFPTGKLAGTTTAATSNAIKNSAVRVGVDSFTGGAEGFIQPFLKKLYSEKSYSQLFQENGGMTAVATNATIAGFFSGISEVPDIRKAISNTTNSIDNQVVSDAFDSVHAKVTNGEYKGNIFSENLLNKVSNVKEYPKVFFDNMKLKTAATNAKISRLFSSVSELIDSKKGILNSIGNDSYNIKKIKKYQDKAYGWMVNEINKNGKIPLETGKYFEELFSDPDYIIGTHRSGFPSASKNENILINGLNLTGHSAHGIGNQATKGIDLALNFTLYDPAKPASFLSFLHGVQTSSSYKTINNIGDAFIVRIPKKYFNEGKINYQNLVFYPDGKNPVLNPEYILGFVQSNKGELGNFNFRKKFLDDKFQSQMPKDVEKVISHETDQFKKFQDQLSSKKKINPFPDKSLTDEQVSKILKVNDLISSGNRAVLRVNNSSELTSSMLNNVSDLSKLEVVFFDGLGNGNGDLLPKYQKPKYYERVTYTGLEMKSILAEIDHYVAQIDMSLSPVERAYQAYELLADSISYATDFSTSAKHKVSASLRGLTSNNILGVKGLVCAGYASAYKEICERVGVACAYIRGYAGETHAWNVLLIDGQEIPVDVTWRVGGKEEWFGASEKFAAKHTADADEVFNKYIPSFAIPSISELFSNSNYLKSRVPITPKITDNIHSSNVNDAILNAISKMDQKYGKGSGIAAINQFIRTGGTEHFTRDGGVRDSIARFTPSEIKRVWEGLSPKQSPQLRQNISPVKNYPPGLSNAIDTVISITDKKNGVGSGLRTLKAVISSGNYDYVTRTNSARDELKKYSISEIVEFLRDRGKL